MSSLARPPGSGRQERPGSSEPSITTVIVPSHGTRPTGRTARRGRCRVLLVGASHQAADLVVDVFGPPQREPHRGASAADALGALQSAARLSVVQPQAQVHPVLRGGPHHGEGPARGDQRDDGLAGLHRRRAEYGQQSQHRVQDRPQLRPVRVLPLDQLVGVGGERRRRSAPTSLAARKAVSAMALGGSASGPPARHPLAAARGRGAGPGRAIGKLGHDTSLPQSRGPRS